MKTLKLIMVMLGVCSFMIFWKFADINSSSLYRNIDLSLNIHKNVGTVPDMRSAPPTKPLTEAPTLREGKTKATVPQCKPDKDAIGFKSPHMVDPPESDTIYVCCSTTKGDFTIAVRPQWAPIGAKRFLEMTQEGFFSTRVALFRALKGFLVQFGLAGDPVVQREWHRRGNLRDDPSWLPLGPANRERNGTKRFQKGYIAYAGGGQHSRSTQLIIAFEPNGRLCGGSPWEVPFGQVVGHDSLTTLGSIYTGYGEKIEQGKIMNRGLEYLKQFPFLDYITSCDIVDI